MNPYRTPPVKEPHTLWLVAVQWGPAWGYWCLCVTRFAWVAWLRAHWFVLCNEWGAACVRHVSAGEIPELLAYLETYPRVLGRS